MLQSVSRDTDSVIAFKIYPTTTIYCSGTSLWVILELIRPIFLIFFELAYAILGAIVPVVPAIMRAFFWPRWLLAFEIDPVIDIYHRRRSFWVLMELLRSPLSNRFSKLVPDFATKIAQKTLGWLNQEVLWLF